MFRLVELEREPSVGLIRRFSDQLKEDNSEDPLQRGLATKVAHDRACEERITSPKALWDPILQDTRRNLRKNAHQLDDDLQKAYDRLQAAWTAVQKDLPKDHRLDLDGVQPDLSKIIDAVQDAATELNRKSKTTTGGKLRSKLRGVCEQIHSHSNVLSVLPKEDKYICLFTGSLSTVMRAAVNYGEHVEQVEQTMAQLMDDLDYWGRKAAGEVNEKIYGYIVELYVLLFEFLTEVFTKWSSSRWARFKSSMNENSIQAIFTKRRDRIRELQANLTREFGAFQVEADGARLDRIESSVANFQQMQLFMSQSVDMVASFILGGDLQRFLQQSVRDEVQQVYRLPISRDASPLLATAMIAEATACPEPQPSARLTGTGAERALSFATLPPASTPPITRPSSSDIAVIQDTIAAELLRVSDAAARIRPLEIDVEVHHHITAWLTGKAHRALWIQGPWGMSKPSQNSNTALLISVGVRKSDVHCVRYFHNISINNIHANKQRQLRDCLLSLIRQLVLAIPKPRLATLTFLGDHMGSIVNGTLDVPTALQLLKPLRRAGPPIMTFIIDGIQSLDDSYDSGHNKQLIAAIDGILELASSAQTRELHTREAFTSTTSDSDEQQITKVCFTTDGYMDELARARQHSRLEKVEYHLESDELQSGENSLLE